MTYFFNYERLATQMAIAPLEPTLPLAGEFWHEGELGILVGQAGVGKSALAVQIALGVATGKTTAPGLEVGLEPQTVLILDHENDDRDIRSRITVEFDVPSNIWRADISPDVALENLDGYLTHLESLIQSLGSSVIIIDNIAWLTFGSSQQDIHKEASALMRGLMRLRKKLDVSILVIAHRNKTDQGYLDISSIAGSSNVTRFVPSVFGIAHFPTDETKLYLKQIKFGRGRPAKWTTNSVLVGTLQMENYLKVITEATEVVRERDLFQESGGSKSDMVRELLRESRMTDGQIAEQLDVSKQLVNRLRKEQNS